MMNGLRFECLVAVTLLALNILRDALDPNVKRQV